MKPYLRFFLILAIINLIGLSFAFAQTTLELFSENQINANYDNLVKNIQQGDVLRFSDGNKFTVDKILGHGATTLVISIQEDPNKALRIPLKTGTLSYIHSYVRGYRAIKESKIPALELFGPLNREYALVEKISGPFVTFGEFIDKTSKINTSNRIKRMFGQTPIPEIYPTAEIMAHFHDFAKTTYAFSVIGDMHRDNLIYDLTKKEWRLMDWYGAHEGALYFKGNTIQYRDTNPLISLLIKYGIFQGMNFKAYDKNYSWIEPMVLGATQSIVEKRAERMGRSIYAVMCSSVFL